MNVDRVEEIRDLYAYDRWANGRVLDAVSGLDREAFTRDLGNSFPSIRDTLVHILSAQWAWLSRWRGHSPTAIPEDWDLSTFDALRARWSEIERNLETFVAGLTEEALGREVTYRNTLGDTFRHPLWRLLRHVVNHSTYHRGQVITMLRQLGAEPVSTDLILYYRLR